MFKNNKYYHTYNRIIEKAKLQNRVKSKENYYESHHIIPKSMGGKNINSNLILLTAREHYIYVIYYYLDL